MKSITCRGNCPTIRPNVKKPVRFRHWVSRERAIVTLRSGPSHCFRVHEGGNKPATVTAMNDFRYAVRSFLKSPGFFAIAVVVLALGIGANTAIFSVVNAVLLRPLIYKDTDRLVMVWGTDTKNPGGPRPVSVPTYREWQSRNTVFDKMAGSSDAVYSLTGIGDPVSVVAYRFDANFFDLLGVQPGLGRTLLPNETQAGQDRIVVLSHRLWQQRFGSDPNVLGRSITLSGNPYTVIGVMPAGFQHPQGVELWTPLVIDARLAANWAARPLRVGAKLKPGVTVAQAQAEMQRIAGEVAQIHPETNAAEGNLVASFTESRAGDIRPALVMLMGAAGFILLITCANLANLLLSRATARSREMGIRTALGASRWRLLRQLVSESFVLATVGGGLGLALAVWTTDLLLAIFPNNIANLNIPKVEAIPIDARVLAFTSAVSILTAFAFGLAPAFHALRYQLNERAPDQQGKRFRRALVVAEVALTLVLLAGAGLMIRSFMHVVESDLGIEPKNVLAVQVFLGGNKYSEPPKRLAFVNDVLPRLQSLSGVESAGATNFLPLSGFWGVAPIYVEGQTPPKPGEEPQADNRLATADYFKTMGIRLVRGRAFSERDNGSAPKVVIINQSLANRFWPNGDPVGSRITIGNRSNPDWMEVVGVVGDVKSFGQEQATHLDIYRPLAQVPFPLVAFTVRTSSNPSSFFASVRQQIWAVDKEMPMFRENTMEKLAAESTTMRRISIQLLGGFALLALLLAAVGTYGVMAYSVSQRFREIGIRMALGAERRMILKLIIGETGRMVFLGITIGLLAALGLTRFVSSLLFGVSAADPAVYFSMSLLLIAVAFIAGYIPARRATRVDPMIALRHE